MNIKLIVLTAAITITSTLRADYWMTMCKTPSGTMYSQVGYVRPDDEGFVEIRTGAMTVRVHKVNVWYCKVKGNAPSTMN